MAFSTDGSPTAMQAQGRQTLIVSKCIVKGIY